jgi:NAD(P)-dependent dehydrogenase (short-subunit alcohol dehydrogenase family)
MGETANGRVALVTGASHGIGRGIARLFASKGYRVVVAGRNAERVATVSQEIGPAATPVVADMRDRQAIDRLVQSAIDHFGRIDVLVNNAGIYPNSPFLELTEDEWDDVFDINVKGVYLLSQTVARRMIEGSINGRIINVSSGASISGRPGGAHYCASKAALNMLTKVMAIELTPKGITVNAVAPGLIEVPNADLNEEYVNAIVAGIPAGRIGKPDDIARAVLFLASSDSDFVSGSIMYVDGGSTAGRTTLPLSSKKQRTNV